LYCPWRLISHAPTDLSIVFDEFCCPLSLSLSLPTGDYDLPVENMKGINLNWHVDKNVDDDERTKTDNLLLRVERGKLSRVR
jgi:hypothetical protein